MNNYNTKSPERDDIHVSPQNLRSLIENHFDITITDLENIHDDLSMIVDIILHNVTADQEIDKPRVDGSHGTDCMGLNNQVDERAKTVASLLENIFGNIRILKETL